MQTQLRLINAQLTPELAVGLLPNKQHCLVTNAITVRGGKRPLTTTEILGFLGHKTDLVVSSNPVTAAGPKEQAVLTTGAQSLAADVLPGADALPGAGAAWGGHPGTGAACAALAALGRTAARALDFTVTRLIFPLADYQLVAGAYHLLDLSWGHYAVLTGYAVAPTICYRRVHLPLLECIAPDPCVVREQVPALMVTSLAVAPDDCCYRPQQPILTFEQPAGALGSVAVEWAGASDCIIGTVWAPDHWTELHYGHSTCPQSAPLTASAVAAVASAATAAATAAGTQVPKVPIAHDLGVTRKELGALDAQLAQALRSQDGFAQASSPLLAPPTALPLNDALEPIFNPEPLAPAYRAFLARQRPCAAHDLYWARSALGLELGADFSAALRSAAAPVGARAAGDVTAQGAVDRSADWSGDHGAARTPRGVRLSA